MGNWILWVVGDRDWSERERSKLKSKVLCIWLWVHRIFSLGGFSKMPVWRNSPQRVYIQNNKKEAVFFFFWKKYISVQISELPLLAGWCNILLISNVQREGCPGWRIRSFDFWFFKRYKLKPIRKGVKFISTFWNSAIEHNGSKK